MDMKPRTGRSRISKASEVVEKKAQEVLPKARGRSKVSKAGDVAEKVVEQVSSAPSGRSKVSKAGDVAQKIKPQAARPEPQIVKPEAQASARRRPQSKADEIGQKIPSSPVSNPVPPQPQQAKVVPQFRDPVSTNPKPVSPMSSRKSGCCAIPFLLGILAAAGALIYIF